MVRLLEAGYQPATSEVLVRVVSILNDVEPAANGLHAKDGEGTAASGSL